MPLVAAAVCPHPPMIVPEIAGTAAAELDDLRSACDSAVDHLLAARPDEVLVVGGAPATAGIGTARWGTFAAWGSPVGFAFGARVGAPLRPLSLLVGGWLLARRGWRERPPSFAAVDATAGPSACAQLGARAVARRRVALLVMGDGSACRGEKSPGYDDPRAQAYDDGVARAMADADAGALLGLDPELSAELKVAGRAAWQALAGAARADGGGWRGALTYYAAPYGVAYLVATWAPA